MQKTVVVVGGGISGLVSGQALVHLGRKKGVDISVKILESTNRLGGQVFTERVGPIDSVGNVIVERGAEGFVARSKFFPEIARIAGIDPSELVNQQRVADNELAWDQSTKSWIIRELDPGVAALKLGFQVPKEDRGRGIRTFKCGMGQLVEAIARHVDCRTCAPVTRLRRKAGKFEVILKQDASTTVLEADAVILATPARVMESLTEDMGITWSAGRLSHHSHVSVHILIPRGGTAKLPKSFTIPPEKQAHFHGLRACSFVNEKFPGRCDDGMWLFRFYFRPESTLLMDNAQVWSEYARDTLDQVFGLKGPTLWSHYAPWISALPSLSPEYIAECRSCMSRLDEEFRGNFKLAGAEVSGAGLEAAGTSGFKAAEEVFDSIFGL